MRHIVLRSLAALVTISCVNAAAQTPNDVRDLVGESARYGDAELRERGFVHIGTQKGADRSWSNWWNAGRRECLSVVTMNGRFQSIVNAPAFDCNQYHETGSGAESDDGVSGAALAVGAAAILGAIALAHKSHHHDDGAHYEDADDDAEFERGYRDALYGHSYDNHQNSNTYSRGYSSGNAQRAHDSSYRQHSGRHDRGYRRAVAVDDLEGARASSADSELSARGFRDVDAFKTRSASYVIWYNRSSGQCIQVMTVDGRAEDISDIGHHPGCR